MRKPTSWNSEPISRVLAGGLQIHICGVSELESLEMPPITHVVSISDLQMESSGEAQRRIVKVCLTARVIHEFFDDVSIQRRGSPSEPAVRRILDFTGRLREGDRLLVHCNLGISRSTAVAYAVACQHAGLGREAECHQAVKEARPIASPNILIVRFADSVLGRRGLMVRPLCVSGPGRASLPERCGICGAEFTDESVYYEASVGCGVTVCELCFPGLGICTGYGRCYLLPDGLRDWWFE